MDKSNVFKIVSTYISIILGAGFISGKELYFFFGQYKYFGTVTLFFSCILFLIILYKQLTILKENNIVEYHNFANKVFNKHIRNYIENISLIFLFVTASTMISAFTQALSDSFNTSHIFSQIIILVVITYFLITGIKKIVILNTFLFPLMFFGIIIIGIYLIFYKSIPTFNNLYSLNQNKLIAFIFALIYVSFNSLTVIPMICNISQYVDTKKTIKNSTIISAITLFILGSCLLLPIINSVDLINNISLPILALIKNINLLNYIYLIVLLLAIISTLISSLYSFTNTLEQKLDLSSKYITKIIIALLALLFSNISFTIFVSVVYPIFGILGLIQIYYILKY